MTFIATIGPVAPGGGIPTGTVLFYIDGVLYSTAALNQYGQTAITVPTASTGSGATLGVGPHTITIVYNGDDDFSSSVAPIPLNFTVQAGGGRLQ
jgi:hypothetical protein